MSESFLFPASPRHDLDPQPGVRSGNSFALSSVVRLLLLLGGIERNPGPGRGAKQRRRARNRSDSGSGYDSDISSLRAELAEMKRLLKRTPDGGRSNGNNNNVNHNKKNGSNNNRTNNNGRAENNNQNNNNQGNNNQGNGARNNSGTRNNNSTSAGAPARVAIHPSVSYAAVAAGSFVVPADATPQAAQLHEDESAQPATPTTDDWTSWDLRRREMEAEAHMHVMQALLARACEGMARVVLAHLAAAQRLVDGFEEFRKAHPREAVWACVAAGCAKCFASEAAADKHLHDRHRALAKSLEARYRSAAVPVPQEGPDVSALLEQNALLRAERDKISQQCAMWQQNFRSKEVAAAAQLAAAEAEHRRLLAEVHGARQELAAATRSAHSQGLRATEKSAALEHALAQSAAAQQQLQDVQQRAARAEATHQQDTQQLQSRISVLMERLGDSDASLSAARDTVLAAEQAQYSSAKERDRAVAAAQSSVAALEEDRRLDRERLDAYEANMALERHTHEAQKQLAAREVARLTKEWSDRTERFKRLRLLAAEPTVVVQDGPSPGNVTILTDSPADRPRKGRPSERSSSAGSRSSSSRAPPPAPPALSAETQEN